MGDPRKTKKHYETPKRPYDKQRLDEERGLVKRYGLKNKRELWRAETILRKKRENARKLLALPLDERLKRQQQLLGSLARLGLLSESSTLDDVLVLSLESLLERRLATMVLRQGLANTISQARQLIVHGHIAVNRKRVNAPSYLVPLSEEKKISYYGKKIELRQKEDAGKEVKKKPEEAVPEKAGGEGQETEGRETKAEKVGEDVAEEKKKKVKAEKVGEKGAAEDRKGVKTNANG